MIRENGLEAYYERRDQVGRPLGDQPTADFDPVSITQIQRQAENESAGSADLSVRGMSCLGCAWLIEELARRQKGVCFARVALNAGRLRLEWEPGEFDLCALAGELAKFGYGISEGGRSSGGTSFSPLGIRLGLTLVFALNGLLLMLAAVAGIGGSGLQQFYDLLILACLGFTQIIGGSLFVKPAWRGLRLRRVHSDALPAFLSLGLLMGALASLFLARPPAAFAAIYFLVLPCLVFARWFSEVLLLRARS
jgi:Cu2+-exporting ATPase